MKYVRTENAIEEVLKEEGELLFTRHGYIPRSMVIEEANAIEDLCDKFTLCEDAKRDHPWRQYGIAFGALPYVTKAVEEFRKYGKRLNRDFCVYGMAWIKGKLGEPILAAVAKMNDEMRLELL